MSRHIKPYLHTLCASTVLVLLGSVQAAPIAGGVYDGPLTSTDDEWASIGENTVTVKNGEVQVVGGFGVGYGGNLEGQEH